MKHHMVPVSKPLHDDTPDGTWWRCVNCVGVWKEPAATQCPGVPK